MKKQNTIESSLRNSKWNCVHRSKALILELRVYLSHRMLALHAHGPEFDPQQCKKKNNDIGWGVLIKNQWPIDKYIYVRLSVLFHLFVCLSFCQ
jgi:hypothetical protein